MPQDYPGPPSVKLRGRWLMLGLTWLVYASFGIVGGSLPPLVGTVTDDLAMSSTQMGLVLGAWQLMYIGTATPLGALVDRFGVRRSMAVGLGNVLLSLLLRAAAIDFFTLFGAVALFAYGGPVISVGAPKMVPEWFQGHERGLAAGIYNTGPLTGMAFALATAASFIEPVTGIWRGIALVYGAIVLAVLVLGRDAPQDPAPAPGRARGPGAVSALLRLRNVRAVLALALVSFLASHGLQNWLPTLLRDDGMSAARAGAWVVAVLLVGSALSGFGLVLLSGSGQVGALLAWAVLRSPVVPVMLLILMETPGVGATRMGAAAGLFFAVAENRWLRRSAAAGRGARRHRRAGRRHPDRIGAGRGHGTAHAADPRRGPAEHGARGAWPPLAWHSPRDRPDVIPLSALEGDTVRQSHLGADCIAPS